MPTIRLLPQISSPAANDAILVQQSSDLTGYETPSQLVITPSDGSANIALSALLSKLNLTTNNSNLTANNVIAETTRAESVEATLQPKISPLDITIQATALTWATSLVIPWGTNSNLYTIATSNALLAFPNGAPIGTKFTIQITQDSVGSRLLAYTSGFVNPSGLLPTLSTAPNSVDFLYFEIIPNGNCLILPIYSIS